ncbi:CapA family protein [Desertivirga arenae]|uniref:CapA family protein n=1 Tax=Desertivirga arenae TaxID=2810309 RepID=UPI001A966967|nr:CapA family protein [Pedobacter sp. SYSU D00823]
MKENVKLFIAGDYCSANRIERLAEAGEVGKIFNDLLSHIQSADLSIVNLECVVTSSDQVIEKTGPALKAKPSAIKALKDAGFDMVTLANNHIMDFGAEGLSNTIKCLKENNTGFVGAGMNSSEASETSYITLKGHRIAIVNISENEFSTTSDDSPGAHSLNVIQNYHILQKARQQADFVILIVHGGHEMYQLPSPRMKELYRFYAEAGASVLINHHQHCYSGFEVYKEVPIFYGIGNFIFDAYGSKNPKHTNTIWNEGFCVELTLAEDGLKYALVPYIQNMAEPGVRKIEGEDLQRFTKEVSALSEVIQDDKQLYNRFSEFCNKKKYIYTSYLEPFNNRLIRGLKKFKVLPYFFTKQQRRLHLNLVRCEAHKDVLLHVLKSLSS